MKTTRGALYLPCSNCIYQLSSITHYHDVATVKRGLGVEFTTGPADMSGTKQLVDFIPMEAPNPVADCVLLASYTRGGITTRDPQKRVHLEKTQP